MRVQFHRDDTLCCKIAKRGENMFEQMSWDSAYEIWKRGSYYFPESLSEPIIAEPVFVEYSQSGYLYGYDWLRNDEAHERKNLISTNPIQFLYFTKPSNKGTIQTAQMLEEAKNEEECAAIWIAATAFELADSNLENGASRYAHQLHYAALSFLREHYVTWHHAMRKLVPEIMIPYAVLNSLQCNQAETVMGLIQMNVMMLKGAYALLRYSSISDAEIAKEKQSGGLSLRL